jgi:hypothetical protein
MVTKLKYHNPLTKQVRKMSLFDEITAHYTKLNTALQAETAGGTIRGARGTLVETMIDIIAKHLGLEARVGDADLKEITVEHNGKIYKAQHQVDRHLYYKGKFVAIVECKAYLDSCYYVRACHDFKRMKRSYPGIKAYVFALEDWISHEAKIFTDADFDNVCDGTFFMCEGKRSSAKPIYKAEYAKTIKEDKLEAFVSTMRTLLC